MCDWDHAPGFTLLLFIFIVAVPLHPSAIHAQQPDAALLNAGEPEQLATAGYYSLNWTAPLEAGTTDAPVFEVVESTDSMFSRQVVVYRGPDLATTVSGKPDGVYYYRVRTDDPAGQAAWSNTHRVVVEHHSLGRAVTFLIIGGIVFAATVIVIVWGYRSERRPDPPAPST